MEEEILKQYCNNKKAIRAISRDLGINRKKIQSVLRKNNILVDSCRKTEEQKTASKERMKKYQHLGAEAKKGSTLTENQRRKITVGKIGYIGLDLSKYTDYVKLRFLIRTLRPSRLKIGTSKEKLVAYLDKFYFDSNFSTIYEKWIFSGKKKWYTPSLDHKLPVSKGGSINDLDNIRVTTWFENYCKSDFTDSEWLNFLEETKMDSELFYIKKEYLVENKNAV